MSIFRNALFMYRGLSEFTKGGYEKAAKTFAPQDLEVDLTGKSYIVTGANSGIGKVAAQEIAAKGGTVHMVCRSRERAEAAKDDIVKATNNENVHIHIVDMSRPNDIRKFVKEFDQPCHVLVNNAGVLLNDRQETPDGLEVGFATNTVGTYLLTELMLPVLKMSSPARVITVASGGMYTQTLDITDLNAKKAYDGTVAYAQHKRQQVCLNQYWSKKVPEDEVKFYVCHPGWAETEGVVSSIPDFYNTFKSKFRTTAQGADIICWLAMSEAAGKGQNGKFWQDRRAVDEHLPFAFTQTTDADTKALVDELDRILANIPSE